MPRTRPSSQHHLLATHERGANEQQRVRRSTGRYEVAGPALQAALRSDESLEAANSGVAPGRWQLDREELGPVAKVETEPHALRAVVGGPKETCRYSLAECPSAQAQLTPRFRACSRRALAPNALLLGPAAAITCRSGVERQAPLPPHAGSEVGSEAGRASTTGTGVALWAAAAAPGGCEGAATG